MRKTMRKIVVRNRTYFWNHKGNRDFVCHSTLTLCTENRKLRIILNFKTHDTFTAGNPLNEGLFMTRGEENIVINLNQPRFAAEMLQYVLDHKLDDTSVGQYHFNGNHILLELGYVDAENYLVDQ
ncbi:hypothetical protein ACFCP7_20065 [Paenibacillus elgii]